MLFSIYRIGIVLLALALWSQPAAAKGLEQRDWIQVKTQNFLFHSILSEEESLELARKMEMFHAVVSKVTGLGEIDNTVPTKVYVLKKPRDFQQIGISRHWSGEIVREYSGYAIVGRDNPPNDVGVYLRKSYARLFVGGRFPFWLQSAVSGYLGTTRKHLEDDGISIGAHDVEKLRAVRLKRSPWIPMREVLTAAEHYSNWTSPKKWKFRSESWVLAHYLMSKPGYTNRFTQYMTLLDSGKEELSAFEDAFGVAVDLLDKEIKNYLRDGKFVYKTFGSAELLPVFEPEVVALSQAQVAYDLANIALDFEKLDQARFLFQSVDVDNDLRARAQAGIGRVLLSRGEYELAQERFERAIALTPDDPQCQYYIGHYWQTRAEEASESVESEEYFERARVYFAKSEELDNSNPWVYADLGGTFLAQGDFEKAIELLETAARLRPTSPIIRLLLAESYTGADRKDDAVREARFVLARYHNNDLRVRAKEVLATVQ